MNVISEKLCEKNEVYRRFCPCLVGEHGLLVHRVLDTVVKNLEPADLDRFVACSGEFCGGEPLYALFSYFKLFRDIPAFYKFINDPDLSVGLLENYIIHLMGFCHEIGQSREDFFDRYLKCLEQNTYVRILRESRYLYRDVDFFIYCLIKLDRKHVGRLMEGSEHIQRILTDIVLNFPEDRIRTILSRNPDIYFYCIKYLEHDRKLQEAESFKNRFQNVIDLARKIQKTAEYIDRINREEEKMERGDRIHLIFRKIQETRNAEETLSVLDYNRVFQDDFEKNIIHRMFSDANLKSLTGMVKS